MELAPPNRPSLEHRHNSSIRNKVDFSCLVLRSGTKTLALFWAQRAVRVSVAGSKSRKMHGSFSEPCASANRFYLHYR